MIKKSSYNRSMACKENVMNKHWIYEKKERRKNSVIYNEKYFWKCKKIEMWIAIG